MKYTGVGSRAAPEPILETMTNLASALLGFRCTLRSGGAPGSDEAFEKGAGDLKEIYLPWKNFNGSKSPLFNTPAWAEAEASLVHPAWGFLKPSTRKLHARNVCQVLGYDRTPSGFLVCWTEDGKTEGGTATAIKVAQALKIPVFNLGAGDLRTHVTNILALAKQAA